MFCLLQKAPPSCVNDGATRTPTRICWRTCLSMKSWRSKSSGLWEVSGRQINKSGWQTDVGRKGRGRNGDNLQISRLVNGFCHKLTIVSGEGEAESWEYNESYLWHIKFEAPGSYARILSQIRTLRRWKFMSGALVPAIKLKNNTKPYNKCEEG